MKIDLNYYLSVFWRRFPYFVVIVALFTSIGVSVAMVLPPRFEATATLLVEQPQIPDRLASSTVETSPQEQLQIIEQRLMTRVNLLDIANRLDVYGDERQRMTATQIVEDMRRRTALISRSGRDAATLMQISFQANASQTAAAVANEFVTLVLQENVEMRTNMAGETLEFFEQEVDRLGIELDNRSTRILEFQNAQSGALPTDEPFLQAERAKIEERLTAITREQILLRDQRQRLAEVLERTGQLAAAPGETLSPDERALNEARAALDEALLVYSDSNPRVRFLEARVELLERRVGEGGSGTSAQTVETAAPSDDGLMAPQLSEIDAQLDALREERSRLEERSADFDARLEQIPANRITLDKLQRDYENVRAQYNDAVSRLAAAETGERIELLAKGERITVVEQATPPERPIKPNRPMIAIAGLGAGIFAGLGLIVLLELLNRSIRRPVELTDRLGITPIGVIPYLKTEREVTAKRLTIIGIVLALLVVLPALLYYVHVALVPLNALLEPYANRLGFSIDPN